MIDRNTQASLNNNDFVSTFEKATKDMVASNRKAYGGEWAGRSRTRPLKDYTREEVDKIINSGSLLAQQRLSRNYFEKDGFYRKLIIYYANLYLYSGLLIPNSANRKNLSKDYIQKRYNNALNFVDKIGFKNFCQHCALNALIDGTYYGIIQTLEKDRFVVLDLPTEYCCSRYKNKDGIDLIEFDITFFDTIIDAQVRESTLRCYPKHIRNWYARYKKGEVKSKWAFVPSEVSICFPLYDGKPLFLNVIPATIDYDDAVEIDKDRDLDEIKKIIVNKIPHLADGELLFEPPEVSVMHEGIVGMLGKNKNIDVLTTYGDVDAIVSKTASETSKSNLEKMVKHIYYEAGTSSQIFSADSNLAIETSINNDMATMAPLIEKIEHFITHLINSLYANSNVDFTYTILPVTYYNQSKYVDLTFKLAMSGYSFLVPAVASGIKQSSLKGLKTLENDILELGKDLQPLASAYTNSGTEAGPGAPKKDDSETSDKTAQNKISLEKQGGNSN